MEAVSSIRNPRTRHAVVTVENGHEIWYRNNALRNFKPVYVKLLLDS
jgi:hypothetical protein